MNEYQRLWWVQASSDHAALLVLRREGIVPCHQLHYLQMITEKLGKAYFWRTGQPPAKSHAGFTQFLRSLGSVRSSDQQRVADVFSFKRFEDLQGFIRYVQPVAYALERLAPSLALDGPNPEYPWPAALPKYAPATYEFDVWKLVANTPKGRQLLWMVAQTVRHFALIA